MLWRNLLFAKYLYALDFFLWGVGGGIQISKTSSVGRRVGDVQALAANGSEWRVKVWEQALSLCLLKASRYFTKPVCLLLQL